MSAADEEQLADLFKREGTPALVQWVRGWRDNLLFVDTRAEQVKRRLDLLNAGTWQLEDGWLDLRDPAVWALAKAQVLEMLRTDNPLGRGIRELAAIMVEGKAIPDGRGRPITASTHENTITTRYCIPVLVSIGLRAYSSNDRNQKGLATASSVVAEALQISVSQVEKWWKAVENQQKLLRRQ